MLYIVSRIPKFQASPFTLKKLNRDFICQKLFLPERGDILKMFNNQGKNIF